MPPIDVIAKGNFGYHPASGNHLQEGELYTIEEEAFSDVLFDRAEPGAADAVAAETDLEEVAD